MKPLEHAERSAKKYGGTSDDYQSIHDILDCTKAAHADMRHRAILHNSIGPFIAEKVYGTYITLSCGKKVSVRQIAEDHIMEDMGRIPNVSEFCHLIPESEMRRFAKSPIRVRTLD